jgi:hypothetical protein
MAEPGRKPLKLLLSIIKHMPALAGNTAYTQTVREKHYHQSATDLLLLVQPAVLSIDRACILSVGRLLSLDIFVSSFAKLRLHDQTPLVSTDTRHSTLLCQNISPTTPPPYHRICKYSPQFLVSR